MAATLGLKITNNCQVITPSVFDILNDKYTKLYPNHTLICVINTFRDDFFVKIGNSNPIIMEQQQLEIAIAKQPQPMIIGNSNFHAKLYFQASDMLEWANNIVSHELYQDFSPLYLRAPEIGRT